MSKIKKDNIEISKSDGFVQIQITKEWYNNSSIVFTAGEISIDGDVRTEGGSDDESFVMDVSEEHTKLIYQAMKEYYEG